MPTSDWPATLSVANQGLGAATGSPVGQPLPDRPTRLIRRLGPHHFAYLRSIAEGLDANDSAHRYLGITHGHERRSLHAQLVGAVQAIARRSGERAWRLVGACISPGPVGERPSLEDFVQARGLDGWSEAEQLEMLEAAYPPDGKALRRQRLRQRQIEMLRRLERSEAQSPRRSDLVSDWFDEVTATRLIRAGHTTLADLARVIAAGGQWYRSMPGVGVSKARRIASHLLTLIPAALPPDKPFFPLRGTQSDESDLSAPRGLSVLNDQTDPSATFGEVGALFTRALRAPVQGDGAGPANRSVQVWTAQVGGVCKEDALLDARTDAEAVQAWIAARCSTPATVRSYSREAQRLMLWLVRERGGRRFAQMRVEDCLAYQAFLQHVPPSWISRDRAAPGQVGWAPFRGPLSVASQVQATRILGGLFAWLAAAKYLAGNPWLLVNTDTGSKDQVTQVLETHAISEGAMAHIHGFLAQQVPSASCQRMQFIVSFVAAVGLRSAELLDARLGAFAWQPEGWTMRVTGKGAKTRTVFVPRPAMEALQTYLAQRGLGGLESAPPDAPLLASTLDAMAPIGYQALYLSVRRWFAKAVSASPLSSRERAELVGASTHWLRHTFGTTAVAREVPYDVIQQQMGHASVNTTMNIYARAPLKRRAQELGKAFG